jgi:hypothetical protein
MDSHVLVLHPHLDEVQEWTMVEVSHQVWRARVRNRRQIGGSH